MSTAEETRTYDPGIKEIGDKIVGLTLLQAKELGDYLESLGIKPAGGVVMAGPVAGGGGGDDAAPAAPAKKTEFDVILTDAGPSKVNVIKVVRTITGLSLMEAKALVEGAPKALKTGLPEEEANKVKAEVEAAGGKAEVK